MTRWWFFIFKPLVFSLGLHACSQNRWLSSGLRPLVEVKASRLWGSGFGLSTHRLRTSETCYICLLLFAHTPLLSYRVSFSWLANCFTRCGFFFGLLCFSLLLSTQSFSFRWFLFHWRSGKAMTAVNVVVSLMVGSDGLIRGERWFYSFVVSPWQFYRFCLVKDLFFSIYPVYFKNKHPKKFSTKTFKKKRYKVKMTILREKSLYIYLLCSDICLRKLKVILLRFVWSNTRLDRHV